MILYRDEKGRTKRIGYHIHNRSVNVLIRNFFLKELVFVLSHLSLESLSYSNLYDQRITSSLPSLDGKK